jgi:recombinational DNA repair ATPase RecF
MSEAVDYLRRYNACWRRGGDGRTQEEADIKLAELGKAIEDARAEINARIELAAQDAIDEIRAAVREAAKFINYSAGQNARRICERLNRLG